MLLSKIRRGEMDRQVTFIKKEISNADSNADNIDRWVEVDSDATVWAKKIDIRGDVGVIADQVSYSQRTAWIVDYRSDVTPTENRLVFDGKVYEILAVTDEGGSNRGMYLNVMTSLINSETWT